MIAQMFAVACRKAGLDGRQHQPLDRRVPRTGREATLPFRLKTQSRFKFNVVRPKPSESPFGPEGHRAASLAFVPSASPSRNCRAIVANRSTDSIMAKLLPMQSLGPPPNGK